jgi:anthranilate/para-aminobenzoate synthase component I
MVTQEVELPVSPAALLTRCAAQPFVFALDGGGLPSWGCGHAVLGFRPRATLHVEASGAAMVCADGARSRWHGDPFVLLDRFRAQWAPADAAAAEPFAGGVLCAVSYDLCQWVERLPAGARDDLALPVLYAAVYDWLLAYSYTRRSYRLASWRCAPAELQDVAGELATLAGASLPLSRAAAPARPRCDFTKDEYVTAVRAALDYVAAGDAYQINLAQRFVVGSPPTAPALFAALQRGHPVPFGAYLDGGDFVLVSNSPECFLSLRGEQLVTFPVKGTRRRGVDAQADAQLVAELQQDPKERAEHVMIVDLERNDLGRVCCTGSVHVDELARVHTFPSLHHMVSKVSGRVRTGTPLCEILRATFPGGSITGAPKIRAMEIIDELEPFRRGFYTGAIGFIDRRGDAVFTLTIRTAVATPHRLTYHAGGGIVADSVPIREYEETLLKAQPFFAALTATAT